MIRRPYLTAALFALGVSAGTAAQAGTYLNERYGFSLQYPDGEITPEPDDSANGDGRRFRAGDDVFVAAFAYARLEEQTPEDIAAEARKDCAAVPPAYRVVRRDLVAMSCIHAGKVYYRKTILGADFATTLEAQYPARDKARWDKVIAGMAQSLRGARP